MNEELKAVIAHHITIAMDAAASPGAVGPDGKPTSQPKPRPKKDPSAMDSLKKLTGISVTAAGILKQSQVFTGIVGTVFQLLGAMIDVILAPFLPLILPAIKYMASLVPIISRNMTNVAGGIIDVIEFLRKGWDWLRNFRLSDSVPGSDTVNDVLDFLDKNVNPDISKVVKEVAANVIPVAIVAATLGGRGPINAVLKATTRLLGNALGFGGGPGRKPRIIPELGGRAPGTVFSGFKPPTSTMGGGPGRLLAGRVGAKVIAASVIPFVGAAMTAGFGIHATKQAFDEHGLQAAVKTFAGAAAGTIVAGIGTAFGIPFAGTAGMAIQMGTAAYVDHMFDEKKEKDKQIEIILKLENMTESDRVIKERQDRRNHHMVTTISNTGSSMFPGQ
jgi:hypothetical protein